MWQRYERLFYQVAIATAFLGVLFDLMKGNLASALFDAGFGVLFTVWLITMKKKP